MAARAQGNRALATQDGWDVWAVGDSGRFYRSFDGGATWTTGTVGTVTLRAVAAHVFRAYVAGDNGVVWTSTNSGGAWASTAIGGAPVLRALAAPADSIAYLAGDNGTLLKTVNAGGTWTPLTSGTAQRIDALAFTDAAHGWAVGGGGYVARTVDGGTNWTPFATGLAGELLAVGVSGGTVVVGGVRGGAARSLDGGAHWSLLDLKLDARSDVKAVALVSPDTVFIAGGGGFVRRSTDSGTSWTFCQSSMHAAVSALVFGGGRGFAASDRHRMVFASGNRGVTWTMPNAGTFTRAWVSKLSNGASIRGKTLAWNPQNPRTLYALMGGQVYVSRDEGDNWQTQGNAIPTATQSNAFVVSPKDSNVFVAATVFSGNTRHVVRSIDGGTSWSTVLDHVFEEYDKPIVMHPDHPDTLYFGGGTGAGGGTGGTAGPGDSLWRSVDFGATWAPWGTHGFRAPCDIAVVPDSGNIILVADGTTGLGQAEVWRSTDNGVTFTKRWTNPSSSEIPAMAVARLRHGTVFATTWFSDGVNHSTDFGATWSQLATTGSAWGTDIATDDPNFVLYSLYSGGQCYLSEDGGANFSTVPLSGANYCLMARDRGLVLALQSLGLYKLTNSYAFTPVATQSLTVTTPVGGENWVAGTSHVLSWNAANVAIVHVEWRASAGDTWHAVADVAGDMASYAWTVPNASASQAQVRMSDAWDGTPISMSGTFAIQQASLAASPQPLACDSVPVGDFDVRVLTLMNASGAPLLVTGVGANSGAFTTARTSFTVPAGTSDTLGVRFAPPAVGVVLDTLVIVSNAAGSPARVPMNGTGFAAPVWREAPARPNFGVVVVGHDGWYPLQLSNPGLDTLFASVSSDRATFAAVRSPVMLLPGQSDTLTVRFTPVAAGVDSAHLTFATNEPSGPHVVTVFGQGTTSTAAPPPLPPDFALAQNEPNPFAATCVIRYALPRPAPVTLELFSLSGRRIATLVHAEQGAGAHAARLDAVHAGLAAGVYFYRLTAGPDRATRKLLVLR